jgi:hypothetical protein
MTLWLVLMACGTPVEAPAKAPPPQTAKQAATKPKRPDASVKKLPGRWQSARRDEELAQLVALGYADGTEEAEDLSGVVQHDHARAYAGTNLYVSGHGPVATLMTMDGTVLHKWGRDWFDDHDESARKDKEFPNHWRRAHLAPNGDLVAIYGGRGMVKLDAQSKVLWTFDEAAHHDLEVLQDGTIWTLTRRPGVVPSLSPEKKVVEDLVVVLDAEGHVQRRISVLAAFGAGPYAPLLNRIRPRGDILHTNTIEILDGSLAHKNPAFRAGNVLLSFRTTDTLAVLDPDREAIVWALSGQWQGQHQPTVLANGRMLLFDNRGLGEASRILELDPFTQVVHWRYGEAEGQSFYTRLLGSAARLPNGNTLITESDNGRVFEVTSAGDTVWRFVTPHRAHSDVSLVASVYEMLRLPPMVAASSWIDPTTRDLQIDMSRTVARD